MIPDSRSSLELFQAEHCAPLPMYSARGEARLQQSWSDAIQREKSAGKLRENLHFRPETKQLHRGATDGEVEGGALTRECIMRTWRHVIVSAERWV